MKKVFALLAGVALLSGSVAQAGVITFEGIATGVNITGVGINTGDNVVSFVDARGPQASRNSQFAVGEYGSPVEGFAQDDIPGSYQFGGNKFLSDEFGTNPNNLSPDGAYGILFAQGVSSVAVDVIDFIDDGGGRVGNRITLELFSSRNNNGSGNTLLGSATYIVTGNEEDGFVTTLSAGLLGNNYATYAIVKNSDRSDVGTGLDNLRFGTLGGPLPAPIPEPGSMAVFALGALCMAGVRRRSRR